MTWGAMVTADAEGTRHPDVGWAFEAWKKTRTWPYTGPAVRTAFICGAEWVLNRLREWESLTEAEAITELRKGTTSVFHPLFAPDPRITVDCPRDGRVVVGVEGYCDTCGYDFTKGA